MKKMLSLSLALVMVITLAGCVQSDNNSKDVAKETNQAIKSIIRTDGSDQAVLEDLRPMIMVNDALYFKTDAINTQIKCGVMDGKITSEVPDTESPTENNQSNFGKGFSYQIYGENIIYLLIDEKWFEFEKKQDDWGITFTAKDVTPNGATIVCEQSNGEQQGELMTGSPYCLQVYKNNCWENLEYIPHEHDIAWTDEGLSIKLDGTTEWSADWQWLYGELPNGTYRIGKSVMNFIETASYKEQVYYAEFNIS